jgi:hypothetical protein
MAGEREHGVTWHLMTADVDAGDVVAEERFPVAPDETAYSLNARCFEAALRSFPRVVAAIASGEVAASQQPAGESKRFGRHARPGSAALVDPRRSAPELVRAVRALDLGDRTANRLGRTRLVSDGRAWLVGAAAEAGVQLAPGDVQVSGDALLVGVRDGSVRLERLTALDGSAVDAATVAGSVGGSLAGPAALAAALDEADGELSRHEQGWVTALAGLEPIALPLSGGGHGWGRVAVDVAHRIDLTLAAAVVATWVARVGGTSSGAVGVVDAEVSARLTRLAPLLTAPVVVVSPEDERAAVQAGVQEALTARSLLVDLVAWMPGPVRHPAPRSWWSTRVRTVPGIRRGTAPRPGRGHRRPSASSHDRACGER